MTAQRGKTAIAHGGEGGLADISAGREFVGPAKDAESMVRAQLETDGIGEIVTTAAVRLEAVARLFYNAFINAAQQGNLEQMDCYVKRYGWLQNSALRAWQQVREGSNQDSAVILSAIESARGKGNEHTNLD